MWENFDLKYSSIATKKLTKKTDPHSCMESKDGF